MNRGHRVLILFLVSALLATWMPMATVLAARGTPGSAEFGFGAHLTLNGAFALESVRLANDLQLDWIAVEISWQEMAPKAGAVDWSHLDPILAAARRGHAAVMLSLTGAPQWALNPQGPDAVQTAQFVNQLVKRYSPVVQAVELYPAANTAQGWGRQPNPQAYMQVAKAVKTQLVQSKAAVRLVGGGLTPLASSASTNDIPDEIFLTALYASDFANVMDILSLQAKDLTGDPLQASDPAVQPVLRHYETIRRIMLNHKHETGMIWVTRLASPSGTRRAEDARYQDTEQQNIWLSQAFSQLKSQLYIGVAFFNAINPSEIAQNPSLIEAEGNYHPFVRSLRELVTANQNDRSANRPGRAKEQPLTKKAP